MDTVTQQMADRIAARTVQAVASMRSEADALEAAGAPTDVIDAQYGITRAQAVRSVRDLADSRERAGARAKVGAGIGQA